MLSDEIKSEIQCGVCVCPTRHCAILEALQIVQKHHGWISDERIEAVAKFLGLTVEEVDGVATFYNRIYRKPVGRHVILVCDSVSCWIMGFENILDELRKLLGIGFGETTPDGRFSVLPIQCLGACEQAPAIMIDGTLYGYLDSDKLKKLLGNYE
ncbi:MAG: NADH-quinone oxidoreductase subunit NuoE [Deltaproteobacteria bacterium]|nr:NADH-quinone oxidoreductase subunit NuoE [Deltaproteobacteria bacterium]